MHYHRLPFLLLLVSLLVGCDQAGSLTEPELAREAPRASLAKADDCGCRDIKATLFTSADFNTFTATGTIVGDLEGSVVITGDPNSLTLISSEIYPPLNPATLSFTTQLEIATEGGDITARVVGVIESGAFGVAAEFHRILSGTGVYAGATGTWYANSIADKTGANFVEHISGEICTPCDGNEMVEVCHVPPGNPSNAHTITIAASALPAHLAHGDTEGPCDHGD